MLIGKTFSDGWRHGARDGYRLARVGAAEIGGGDRHRRAPALDAVRDGVQDALKQAGYEPGKNLKWQYQSAQGNNGTAAQIARKFVGDKPDAIVAIATPSARPSWRPPDVPVVYSAVTDPVAAQLVASMEPTGTNVTGVSDLLALDKQIDLIKKIVPNAKRVGMVYNPARPTRSWWSSCRSCCPSTA